MSKGKWDLTSKHSLDAAAEWIRKGSNAQLVLVIRPEDMSFAVHSQISPSDAIAMVDFVLPELKEQLANERQAARDEADRKRQAQTTPQKTTRKKCVCAQQMYRNNHDGSREYVLRGEASCAVCQGYGLISTCTKCDGCGLLGGDRCPECFGFGQVPNKEPQQPTSFPGGTI